MALPSPLLGFSHSRYQYRLFDSPDLFHGGDESMLVGVMGCLLCSAWLSCALQQVEFPWVMAPAELAAPMANSLCSRNSNKRFSFSFLPADNTRVAMTQPSFQD
ncbi:hypothetical protein DV515_00002074 [Chloebia gouldiae]|uniref:Uncharacterized protein n=1 Tax=Chloebia gouldiae TaxID=44316 RepID=A0A3L8SX16_CHLGU|nr:hypothetical protein DV515_00002074 [Chloebia gouldiae]